MPEPEPAESPTGPRVVVLGAGAVGAHIGALLALGGTNTTLIGRPRVLEPMAAGVTIRRPDGSVVVGRPKIVVGVDEAGTFDVVLLTVKAYSVQASLDAISQLLSKEGRILAFQNGVGSDRMLLDRFGRERIIASTSTISVGIEEPGTVTQYTNGGLAWAPYGAVDSRVSELLLSTGLPVAVPATPASLRWSKLLLNAVGSAQCAILGTNLDRIVADSRLFRVEKLAFAERTALLKAAGIKPVDLPGYRVRLAAMAMKLPTPIARTLVGGRMRSGRGGKAPTLRADVERGGPTENRFLNGATVDLGKETGVATPVNAMLTQLVDQVTESPELRARFRDNPEALLEQLRASGVRV